MTSSDQTSEQSSIRQVVAASFIGTTIEWYDFFLYGTAARPLGGIIFGHFGDRIGRKTMLVLSLRIMGVATFLIGLMPTYNAIGIAVGLFVRLRWCSRSPSSCC